MKKIILLIILLISILTLSNSISFTNSKESYSFKKIKEKSTYIDTSVKRIEKQMKLLLEAKQRIGKEYVYGAKASSLTEYDCSSFIKQIFKLLDIKLPRTSKEQSQKVVIVVNSDLEIGDLLFFNTLNNGVSHVGMYIGNNKFVHASSKANMVIVSELSSFYEKRLVTIRRVI